VLLPREKTPESDKLPQVNASEAVSAATAAVSDMSQFCKRQPAACEVGGQAATVIGHRAQEGARKLYQIITDKRASEPTGSIGGGAVDASLTAEAPRDTCLIAVEPDGTTRIVAESVAFPNGSAITPDGRTLLVGESMGRRISAFDIAPDGSLSNQRVWAQLHGATVDGMCLDAEGAVWTACPGTGRCLRVREGGDVLDEVKGTHPGAYACMLGGTDRRAMRGAPPEHERGVGGGRFKASDHQNGAMLSGAERERSDGTLRGSGSMPAGGGRRQQQHGYVGSA